MDQMGIDFSVPSPFKSDGGKRPSENRDDGDLDMLLYKKARGVRIWPMTWQELQRLSWFRWWWERWDRAFIENVVGTFIEDLRFNRSKDQKSGFHPPKMSTTKKFPFMKWNVRFWACYCLLHSKEVYISMLLDTSCEARVVLLVRVNINELFCIEKKTKTILTSLWHFYFHLFTVFSLWKKERHILSEDL